MVGDGVSTWGSLPSLNAKDEEADVRGIDRYEKEVMIDFNSVIGAQMLM